MAPNGRAAASGRGKFAKPTTKTQKTSAAAAASRKVAKPKLQSKGCRAAGIHKSSAEKKNVTIGGNSKRPIEVKAPKSSATKKKRHARLSMAAVLGESCDEDDEDAIDHAAEFVSGSTALSTWGALSTHAVPAVRNERRHTGLRGLGLRRGKDSAFVKFMYGTGTDQEGNDDTVKPFRFLDLPLEIRLKIYGLVLTHPYPIMMRSDWVTVHTISSHDQTILRVNKQILHESVPVLYGKNIFRAVVSSPESSLASSVRGRPSTRLIMKEYLQHLKNVIIECRFGWHINWSRYNMIEPVAACLSKLIRSAAVLDSLTLIMSPIMELNDTNTALVLSHPLLGKPLSEYFRAPSSKIMCLIPKLRCKVLNIILRIPEGRTLARRKRVVVSLDLRALPVNQQEEGWLAEDEASKVHKRKRKHQLKRGLLGLEKRIEDILENADNAIMQGKARLMAEDESPADGMSLASRG